MFCTNCGKEIPDGSVCSCQPQPPVYSRQPTQAGNSKIFSILAYISPLWLIRVMNANKGETEQLPIIGRFAFFK